MSDPSAPHDFVAARAYLCFNPTGSYRSQFDRYYEAVGGVLVAQSSVCIWCPNGPCARPSQTNSKLVPRWISASPNNTGHSPPPLWTGLCVLAAVELYQFFPKNVTIRVTERIRKLFGKSFKCAIPSRLKLNAMSVRVVLHQSDEFQVEICRVGYLLPEGLACEFEISSHLSRVRAVRSPVSATHDGNELFCEWPKCRAKGPKNLIESLILLRSLVGVEDVGSRLQGNHFVRGVGFNHEIGTSSPCNTPAAECHANRLKKNPSKNRFIG